MKFVLLYTSSHFKDNFINMFCIAVLLCISLAFFMSRGVYIFFVLERPLYEYRTVFCVTFIINFLLYFM